MRCVNLQGTSWASNLVEKQISIATLANLYTIIGL